MHNFPSKCKDMSCLFMKWEQAENKDIGGNKHIFPTDTCNIKDMMRYYEEHTNLDLLRHNG